MFFNLALLIYTMHRHHFFKVGNMEPVFVQTENNGIWWLQPLVTFSAVLVALFVAIFSERMKLSKKGPVLAIDIDTMDDNLPNLYENGLYSWYSHIYIKNTQKNTIANRVRVLLTKVYKKSGNDFQKMFMAGPLPLNYQYVAAKSEYFPALPSLSYTFDLIADFGFLVEKSDNFKLSTVVDFPDTIWTIKKDETFRYEIVTVADNALPAQLYLEVYWDGIWVNDPKEIIQHLQIRKLTKSNFVHCK